MGVVLCRRLSVPHMQIIVNEEGELNETFDRLYVSGLFEFESECIQHAHPTSSLFHENYQQAA